MQIVILANDEQKDELSEKKISADASIEYVTEHSVLLNYNNADAFFSLSDELPLEQLKLIKQPVFIHSVASTLHDLNLPANVSRLNAWPTFLQRDLWEIATKNEDIVKKIFDHLQWKYIAVPDEPGFIAARVIAMIINEAYFAYEEKISTKKEIDTAMKLGTNYPYGPFEWAEKIGLDNIYNLLKVLCKRSPRYQIALSLTKESTFI